MFWSGNQDLLTIEMADTDRTPRKHQNDVCAPLKIITLGDSGVGKSTLLERFCTGQFRKPYRSTRLPELVKLKAKLNQEITINVDIWDTAGQEKFNSLTTSYYRNCHAVVLVFSINSERSFLDLANWVLRAKQNHVNLKSQGGNVVSILLGNKVDLCPFERQVDQRDAMTLAKNLGIEYFETSALTKERVTDAFNFLIYRTWMEKLTGESLWSGSSTEITSGLSLVEEISAIAKSKGKGKHCCL